jgi:ribose-phosphate pyrophosphokinase
MKLFSGSSNKPLAEAVATSLGITVSPLEIFVFPDGERRVRVLENVVDEDVIVVQSTARPVDQNYMELFFIVDALKRSGARRVLAVIPYLGYQRQDHVFRDGEAVSLAVMAKTLAAVGIDKIFSFDLHSVRVPEVFHIPLVHLSALSLFADEIRQNHWDTPDAVLVSPDIGGLHRIKQLSSMLAAIPFVTIEKNRDLATGKVEAVGFNGTVAKRALIVDDMISSGLTMVKAAELLQQQGAEEIYIFATHAVFAENASQLLQNASVAKVFVTDSVFVPPQKRFAKLAMLSIAPILAAEITQQ